MKRKAVLFVYLMLILSMLLAACNAGGGEPAAVDGTQEPVAGEAPEATVEPDPTATPEQEAIDSYEALLEALRAAGLEVEAVGPMEDPFFDVETQTLMVGEAMIQVFQFASAAEAEAAAGTVNAGGTIIGTTTVDWIEPPHFYRHGRLLVLYAGSDENVLSALEAVLGEPFVIGQTMGMPAANGGPAVDYAALVKALEATGATVEPLQESQLSLFDIAAQSIELNGAQVQVFEFAGEAAAQAAADTVGEDGTSIGNAAMRWAGAPHFYKMGRLIVLYVGSDGDVLSLLESVLGPYFAGSA